jgi:predicted Zn-dependent peptidase
MKFDYFTLPNGMRVIHHRSKSPVAHCGLFINAGSRDEMEGENGLAHFIEHVIFKGTKKRKPFHILSRMEDVGGELNAYTSKEETVIHTSFLKTYYPRAIELISDIFYNSTFPQKEIEKEKAVVIDEINSYLDSPGEQIFDDFEELLFKGHPLGQSVLGTPESVNSFDHDGIQAFIARNYSMDEIVFSSVGNISSERLERLLNQFFHDSTRGDKRVLSPEFPWQKGERIEVNRDTFQTHCVLGNQTVDVYHKDVPAVVLLNNLLGGPGMNSRLNLNIRERYGFTYNIESYYSSYRDTGVFGIYLGTDKGTIDKSIQLVHRELKKLREKKLGVLQLSKAKKQLLGQMAMAADNNGSLMLAMGRSLLIHDRMDDWNATVEKVESVSSDDLLEMANRIFNPEEMTYLIYKAK